MGYSFHTEVNCKNNSAQNRKKNEDVNYQLNQLAKSEYWNDLLRFADDIFEEIQGIEQLSQDKQKEYWNGLYEKIALIEYRCYYFAIYLLRIDKRDNKFVQLFMNVFDQWCVLAAVIMKNVLRANYRVVAKKIHERIKNIALEERDLVLSLIDEGINLVEEKKYLENVNFQKGVQLNKKSDS